MHIPECSLVRSRQNNRTPKHSVCGAKLNQEIVFCVVLKIDFGSAKYCWAGPGLCLGQTRKIEAFGGRGGLLQSCRPVVLREQLDSVYSFPSVRVCVCVL